MGRLSTHVLDTASGRPAAGMRIDFSVIDGERWRLIKTLRTNADGRTDEPLLAAPRPAQLAPSSNKPANQQRRPNNFYRR